MKYTLFFILILFITAFSAEVEPLKTGAKAPDFKLPGVDGKTYTLENFSDADILTIVFTANHCPTAQAYEDKLIQLVNDFSDRGVAFVAISPNDPKAVCLSELGYSDLGDSFEDMKRRVKDKNYNFPYLYDGDEQAAAKAYGPVATPHVFVFDADRRLRYNGRIDDTENPYKTPETQDLRRALEALLAGESVPVAETNTFGCSIKWASKRELRNTLDERWQAEPVELNSIDAAGIREVIANDSENYRLVNVWATWCGPCVAEFPELVKIYRMYKGRDFELVTISADAGKNADKVVEFLKKQNAAFTNYHFTSDDRDALMSSVDSEWRGGIPYTLFIAPGGEVLYRHMGMIEPLEVKQTIIKHLGRYYADDE